MPLTEETALRAYAKMMNTLNVEYLEALLADDFIYESQNVFQPIKSKHEFLKFIRQKLITIQNAKSAVFAEMGTVEAHGRNQSCVILAQNDRDNLVGLAFATIEGEKLKRIDHCIVPPSQAAKRSGVYPK